MATTDERLTALDQAISSMTTRLLNKAQRTEYDDPLTALEASLTVLQEAFDAQTLRIQLLEQKAEDLATLIESS